MSAGSRLFNRPRVILDRHLTPANAIDKALAAHPERRLFQFDGPTGYAHLSASPTVRDIHAFVLDVGDCLVRSGMRRFDRVVIYKTNSLDYFFLVLAVIRAGGIAVPVNSGLPLDKLREYVAYTGAGIVMSDAEHFAAHIQDPSSIPEIRAWIFPDVPAGFTAPAVSINATRIRDADRERGPAALGPDDPVMIVHTSGTTGFPKGVIATSRSIVQGIKRHYRGEPISVRNNIALAGHFNHLVCQLGLFTSLLGNIPVHAFTDLSPAHLLSRIESRRINIFFAFPDVYLGMYLHGLDRYDLSSVKVWIATADASHQVHMRAFCEKGAAVKFLGRKLMGAVFIEPLGSSEVGFAAVERFFLPWSPLRSDRCVGWRTVGGPRVRVADEHANPVARHRPGRLMVKGPTVSPGYWDGREPTPGATKNGWRWTGDIVYKDWLGRYHHLDRDTDVIRTPKGDVYTLPIEECLLQHPKVGEVAVVALEQPGYGMVPVAIAHPKPDASLDGRDLLDWANQRLRLATPLARVVVVHAAQIPRGLTGKVLKRELREHFASLLSRSDAC